LIQVDGGITVDNISQVASKGASVFVTGSAAFHGDDINQNVLKLKKKCKIR
jgi:ribulose-phosphate 3-epimerase